MGSNDWPWDSANRWQPTSGSTRVSRLGSKKKGMLCVCVCFRGVMVFGVVWGVGGGWGEGGGRERESVRVCVSVSS
jgi:hypothetical protein